MSWLLSCIGCGGKKFVEKEETRTLDFQHYSLSGVPPYVFECERFLEELYLDYNQISELPKELFLCNELQILSLSDNDLHHLPPAISSLSNLTSLDLSKNGISDIPDNIKACKRLRCVNASTNPLCRLPEGFTQLVALKELSLSDTFLEYLPANFGRLTGLEVLELRENQLNTLPRSMTRLTALKRLDLGQNEFTELPEVVGHLTSLTDLWIDNNRVKRIPPEIGKLSHLTFLDASKNRLIEIDPEIGQCKSLTHLYLTRNNMEVLPDNLSECTSLSTLQMDDNHLDHLPEDMGKLDNLIELKLSQNELSKLPPSVGLLRNLQFLHVDENLLSSLPSELGSCSRLIVLTAAHNLIENIPAEIGSLARLRVINFCGNSIQCLPVSMSKLQLSALWLSQNQAKPSVPLQVSKDATGQKVLTCFMLPQSETQESISVRIEEEKPITEEEIEARRARRLIHFAADGETTSSGRLSRVPTPYPKELRALAKHTKNIMALKKDKSKGDQRVAAVEKKPTAPTKVSGKESKQQSTAGTGKSSASMTESPSTDTVSSSKSKEDAGPCTLTSSAEVVRQVGASNEVVEDSEDVLMSKEREKLGASSRFYKNEICPPANLLPTDKSDTVIAVKSPSDNNGKSDESALVGTKFSSSYTPVYETLKSITSDISYSKDSQQTFKTSSELDGKSNPILRPASIAVPEPSLSSFSSRTNYSARPGSLALEGFIPPWSSHQRPGSLAAPINTVGIPTPDRSMAQPSHESVYEPVSRKETGLSTEHHDTSGEVEDLSSPDDKIYFDESEGSPDNTSLVKAMNEKNLAQSQKDNKHSPSTLSADLVSIIDQVTEEELNDDHDILIHQKTHENIEVKYSSRIPTSFVKNQPYSGACAEDVEKSPIETSDKVQEKPFTTGLSSSSKIPHFSSTPKVATVSPLSSNDKSPSLLPSNSRIRPPNWRDSPRLSEISPIQNSQPNKGKSHNTNIGTHHHDPAPDSQLEGTKIPKRGDHHPSYTKDNPSKATSRIPSLSSTPEAKPELQKEFKVTSQQDRKLLTPGFKTSALVTPERGVPFKRSDSGNRKNPPMMSPMEDPINQTGIPMVSPDRINQEKSSRIPTFSNTSLRGKKSPKSHVSRTYSDT